MRAFTRFAGRLLQVAVVGLMLGAAAFMLVPRLLGWQVVTVLSSSMEPAYPIDTALAVRPVDPSRVREGDVIAFMVEADRPMVTHRVVAIESNQGALTFITKGDANEDPDANPVPASAVRGRVVASVPHLGLFVRAVHTSLGFTLLLVLPGLVLIGQELRSLRRGALAAPAPASTPTTADDFDFWTTYADEARYYEELDREVRKWCDANV